MFTGVARICAWLLPILLPSAWFQDDNFLSSQTGSEGWLQKKLSADVFMASIAMDLVGSPPSLIIPGSLMCKIPTQLASLTKILGMGGWLFCCCCSKVLSSVRNPWDLEILGIPADAGINSLLASISLSPQPTFSPCCPNTPPAPSLRFSCSNPSSPNIRCFCCLPALTVGLGGTVMALAISVRI